MFVRKLFETRAALAYSSGDHAHCYKSSACTPTPGAIMDFAAVITSRVEDRDGDILEPAGAEIDEKMPLLWQHNPAQPIGVMKGILSRDASQVLCHFAVADTQLGRDAANLIEFGAVRMSVGFTPKQAEPRKAANGRQAWLVKSWDCLETSLVAIPSNPTATIQSFSRRKCWSPAAQDWCDALRRGQLGVDLDHVKQRLDQAAERRVWTEVCTMLGVPVG